MVRICKKCDTIGCRISILLKYYLQTNGSDGECVVVGFFLELIRLMGMCPPAIVAPDTALQKVNVKVGAPSGMMNVTVVQLVLARARVEVGNLHIECCHVKGL